MEGLWFGEGSIKEVENGRRAGKWRLRWAFFDPDDKKRVEVDKYFERQADARKWREDKKKELLTGKVGTREKERKGLTMQGFFDELCGSKALEFRDGKWVADGSEPQTVGVKFHRWNKWVKGSPLASKTIRSLVRDDARAHVRRMKEEDASIATMTDVLGVLKKVANDAIREKPECRDLHNPFVGIALQTNAERAEAAHVKRAMEADDGPAVILLSPGQAASAIRQTEGETRAMLAVLLLSGLRISEMMALTREQIDFARAVIVVDRSEKAGPNGTQWTGLPKRNKTRVAAMCPALARILEDYLASLPPSRTILFGATRTDDSRTKKQTYIAWRDAVKAGGLPEGLTPKMCRASHNNWVEKLMPAVSLSVRLEHMGHSLSRGAGQPLGVGVNIRNYTGFIPEGYDVLRSEIERVIMGSKITG